MEPEEALHWHILRRKKDGVEDWIDRSVEKIGAVPTLNEVLLPAMKEVGDKFGAGELILPFVLQSAEVMKRAVAQLENYLDRIEGHTKGKVVIATVFGDVHDIGKSLVNTILTNNGYTVIDLGKQVPVDTIIEAAVENEADAIGLSALLVSTSKQMPTCVAGAAPARARVPGADRRRRDQPRLRPPHALPAAARSPTRSTSRASSTARTPSRASTRWTRWSTSEARAALVERIRAEAKQLREKPVVVDDAPPTTDDSVRSARAHRQPDPRAALLGRARGRRSTSTRSSPTSTATCSSSCTGAAAASRARPGASWSRAPTRRRASRRAWSGCGASRTTSTRGRGSATSPATPTATSWSSSTPRTPSASSSGSSSRASRKHDRICLADFFRPLDSGERDVVALQGVTVGPEVTELIERLESEGEFAEQLYVHGLGVQSAEGLAEWLHSEVRRELGIDLDQGRRYSWGYPACPDQSEHEKVWRLLGLEEIGMTLSGGYAVMPEQSTVAIVAHHPQAVYFGMKSGFIPEDKAPDELIAGTERGGELPPEAEPVGG